jgi:plasmid stabilization system protein ParE
MPTDSVEFHEEATAEYDAAFDWYLEQSPDAARKFDAEMDRALARILQAPRRWTAGPHSTRRFLLRQFPFIVIYRQLASAHIHRGDRPYQPKTWILDGPNIARWIRRD